MYYIATIHFYDTIGANIGTRVYYAKDNKLFQHPNFIKELHDRAFQLEQETMYTPPVMGSPTFRMVDITKGEPGLFEVGMEILEDGSIVKMP